MKSYFCAIGLITNMFFMSISINSMQPGISSGKLVHTRSLPFQKETNTIAQTILTKKWDDAPVRNDQIKRHLLELAEWHAHIMKKPQEEKIYLNAQKSLGNSIPIIINADLPKLTNPSLKIPHIENPELNALMSEIGIKIRTITLGNFDKKIEKNNTAINTLLETSTTETDYKKENELKKLITIQLNTIKAKMDFTQDPHALRTDLGKLSAYKNNINGANLDALKQLEEKTKTIENIVQKKAQQIVFESIPKKSAHEPKTVERQKNEDEILNLNRERAIIPYYSPEKSTLETDQGPSQATEGESSEQSEPPVITNKSEDKKNDGATQQQPKKTDLPGSKAESPLTQAQNTAIQAVHPSNPPTETQTPSTSSLWNSWTWITKKISDFFDRFFWSIYGYR